MYHQPCYSLTHINEPLPLSREFVHPHRSPPNCNTHSQIQTHIRISQEMKKISKTLVNSYIHIHPSRISLSHLVLTRALSRYAISEKYDAQTFVVVVVPLFRRRSKTDREPHDGAREERVRMYIYIIYMRIPTPHSQKTEREQASTSLTLGLP